MGKAKRERTVQEINKTGYNFGLGVGLFSSQNIVVGARGEFSMGATGDTSRKFVGATAGITYRLTP